MTTTKNIAIDSDSSGIWVGRAQALFSAFQKHIPEVELMTPGMLLEVYTDKRLSNRDRLPMTEVLHLVAGFRPQSIGDGLFNVSFLRQLEYLCGGLKNADDRGLIRK